MEEQIPRARQSHQVLSCMTDNECRMDKALDELDASADELSSTLVELRALFQEKRNKEFTEFFDVIRHGDESHQAWLKGVIEEFFKVKIT